ncbi:MAG: rRNA maturation RNase YbeY [Treponema sp.]|nr:rRNA maturation RNase YbeY [Treponema sp.]
MEDGREEPAWFSKIEPFMLAVLDALGYKNEELSVMFCGDAFIQSLNKQYRDIDAPTDVLSFEDGDEYADDDGKTWLCAGDIIISLETLPVNAKYFGVSENEELKRLLIHGTLHLNGYDHGEAHVESGVEPDDEMLKLQETVLRSFSDVQLLQA